jgi:hypothetical protein
MRLYKTDWTAFATWCEATGLAALPAAPATVPGILRAAAERLSAARWAAVPPPSPTNTAGAVSLRQSPIRW